MSRWRRWSNSEEKLGFGRFIVEATKPQSIIPTDDPAEYARQQGWTPAPFGYFKDSNGQVVARSIAGKLVSYDGQQGASGGAPPVDMGNPAVTAGQTPADRARSLGLQSNGRGSYMDQAGNVVARTVNNELVFYDENQGAVSDGGGGMALATAQPSWVDDVTGLIVVPPAKPESPAEIATVPDPTPPQPPAGYNDFIQRKKLELYAQNKEQEEAAAIEQQKQDKINQAFSSSESASAIRSKLQPMIDSALESGDEWRGAIAQNVTDLMAETADEMVEAFETLPPEDHEEAIEKFFKYFVHEAKGRWASENIWDPIKNNPDLDDDQKFEAREIARQDKRASTGGLGFIAHVRRMIDDMDNKVKERSDQLDDEKYEGDLVNFTLQNPDERFIESAKIIAKARKTLKKYDIKPTGIRNVRWDLNNEEETDDPQEKIKASLDALKVWRTQVLPDLEPGTILTNQPTEGGRSDNQRERIYQLAGFGEFDENLGAQSGIVVDEDGEKKVVPLNGKRKSKKLKESLMNTLLSVDSTTATLILERYL